MKGLGARVRCVAESLGCLMSQQMSQKRTSYSTVEMTKFYIRKKKKCKTQTDI